MHPYAIEIDETAESRRERLVLEHLPQVHLIARRFHEKLPKSVCLDDLISTGVIGLLSAINHYDPRQNAKLKTYAEFKIRGAILDSLRGLDWVSRHRRKKAKDIQAAIQSAQQKLQVAPTEEEIAAEMGISLEEYRALLVEVQGLDLESLDMTTSPSSNQTLLSQLPDSEDNLPSAIFERNELEQLLAAEIDRMPERERLVLSLYYREELTLREIAEVMDLHISRVAELKSNATLRLRSRMKTKWPASRAKSA
ncbi:MAG TPA: FliA/WhiG family RNA polymerase sigma factor [Bryobacteraceae bacterium]|nr:FliA/WhiG family RNA polymerase sigma factor [Bryobacteraceae bacterium]